HQQHPRFVPEQTEGAVDVFVSGVGTGGTITGVSRYIKRILGKELVSVAVEPAESPILTQHLAGEELVTGKHLIQGIGAGFVPNTLDLTLVDRVERVTSNEAITFTRRLASEECLLCGISSGAAAAIAVKLAQLEEFAGKTIVVVLPDAGERYLSTVLFDGIAVGRR
ncbi:MAG: pyridoxal-phosphate dependent enzyme, partial [bacterium]